MFLGAFRISILTCFHRKTVKTPCCQVENKKSDNVQLTKRGTSVLGHEFVMNLEHVHFVQYVECINAADNLDDLSQRLFNLQMTMR